MTDKANTATPMTGKTVLITGATSGIGRAGAIALAQMGASLILSGRNSTLGHTLTEQVSRLVPGSNAQFLQADLSLHDDVRRLARQVLAITQRLDVLINNAGAIFTRRQITPEGVEMTLALNHIAPFLLTSELLELLTSTSNARVITTSSTAHHGARIDWDDINSSQNYRGFTVYGRSKLANILFTNELARRTAVSGLMANCFHPGVVRTGFGHNLPGAVDIALRIASPFLLSPESGAKTMVYLASSPEVSGISGAYFVKCKAVTPSRAAQDTDDARRLWTVTEELITQTGKTARKPG